MSILPGFDKISSWNNDLYAINSTLGQKTNLSDFNTHVNNNSIHFTASERQQLSSLVSQIGNKIDKVSGKDLSTNDYTTTEKNKLAALGNYTSANGSFTLTSSNRDTYVQGNGVTLPANSMYIVIVRGIYNAVGSGGTGHCRLQLFNSTDNISLCTVSNNDNGWCAFNCSTIIAPAKNIYVRPRMSGSFSTRSGTYIIQAVRLK